MKGVILLPRAYHLCGCYNIESFGIDLVYRASTRQTDFIYLYFSEESYNFFVSYEPTHKEVKSKY